MSIKLELGRGLGEWGNGEGLGVGRDSGGNGEGCRFSLVQTSVNGQNEEQT